MKQLRLDLQKGDVDTFIGKKQAYVYSLDKSSWCFTPRSNRYFNKHALARRIAPIEVNGNSILFVFPEEFYEYYIENTTTMRVSLNQYEDGSRAFVVTVGRPSA